MFSLIMKKLYITITEKYVLQFQPPKILKKMATIKLLALIQKRVADLRLQILQPVFQWPQPCLCPVFDPFLCQNINMQYIILKLISSTINILILFLPEFHLSSHLSSLTLEVVGASQMTLQQYLSILPCLPLPSGNCQTPFSSIPWCYLPISSSVFLSFLLLSLSLAELSSPCQRILKCGHTIWVSVSLLRLGDHHALQLHSGFCWEPPHSSHGLCRKCSEVSYSIASHLKGLNPSLDFCCQGPALTGIKEGR